MGGVIFPLIVCSGGGVRGYFTPNTLVWGGVRGYFTLNTWAMFVRQFRFLEPLYQLTWMDNYHLRCQNPIGGGTLIAHWELVLRPQCYETFYVLNLRIFVVR